MRAEIRYIIQVLGALEKPIDGDAVLQGLAVNQRLLCLGQSRLMGIVKQRLLQLGGGRRDGMEGGGGKRGQTEESGHSHRGRDAVELQEAVDVSVLLLRDQK